MYLKGRFPWQRAESNVTQEQYLELLQNLIEHGSFEATAGQHITNGYINSSPDASGEHNESLEPIGDKPEEIPGTE